MVFGSFQRYKNPWPLTRTYRHGVRLDPLFAIAGGLQRRKTQLFLHTKSFPPSAEAAQLFFFFFFVKNKFVCNVANHSCIQKFVQTTKQLEFFFFCPFPISQTFSLFLIPRQLKTELPESTHHFLARTPPNLHHRLDTLPMLLRGHPRSKQRQETEGAGWRLMR